MYSFEINVSFDGPRVIPIPHHRLPYMPSMCTMKLQTLAWTDEFIPALDTEAFQGELERLESRVIALEAVAQKPPKHVTALADAVLLTDRARDLVQSLKSVCRARQSLKVTDTLANSWRVEVTRLGSRLEKAAEPIAQAVFALPEDARSRAPFDAWCSTFLSTEAKPDPLMSAVMLPLSAHHDHLTSTMKLRVPSEDGHLVSMSYAQATALMKTSDNPRLSRAVFGNYNAWFAEQAPAFADLLNAVLGWKLYEAEGLKQDFFTHSLAEERISPAAYEALSRALIARQDVIRSMITKRAEMIGQPRLHVTQILYSMPTAQNRTLSGLGNIHETLASFSEAMKPADPSFTAFVNRAVNEHWIDAQPQSGRGGGAWCEDMPAFDSVAIFANYPDTTAGAFQFGHPCGCAFLHQVLHQVQAPLKRLPLSIIEIFGQICESMLERMMLRQIADTPEAMSLRWQIMRRASNHLMMLPFRHNLLKKLYAARRAGVLSVGEINDLTVRAWNEVLGDTVMGLEQYIWCWKPHFYRLNGNFYDWQYTFGYLVSQSLAERFLKDGKTAAGSDLTQLALDAARLDCDKLLRKHLDADIRSQLFWENAIDTAVNLSKQ